MVIAARNLNTLDLETTDGEVSQDNMGNSLFEKEADLLIL